MSDTYWTVAKLNNFEQSNPTYEKAPQIWEERVTEGTHKGIVYRTGSRNNLQSIQSRLEGIELSHQDKAIDGFK